MIAESLNSPNTVVLRILKEDLGKRKLCARFVPHKVFFFFFFTQIITGDETWCFAYDPETKRQSSEWVGETFPWPK